MDLKFILLAYFLGPIMAVPYALKFLSLTPILIFIYLTFLYLLAIPIIFKALELGKHSKIYKAEIIKKICQSCEIKAEEEVKKIQKSGNELIGYFQKKVGHLGFYLAISLFTFLFGIFWSAFLSYFLKLKRKRAILAIILGVLFGNLFWVFVMVYSLPLLKSEMIILLLVFYLIIYGRQREIAILKRLGKKARGMIS